jgi:nitroreductase
MDYLERLNWRYATKRMTGKKIDSEQLERILEAIRLSASSLGLQPYQILVIEDQKTRDEIYPHAYKQAQLKEASHILVFAFYRKMDADYVEEYLENIAKTRGVTLESLAGFRKSILGSLERTEEELQKWFSRQAYIALGTGLFAAALEGVDATPMEGFVPEKVDEVLGLEGKNLRSVCMLALGERDISKDSLASAKKVRQPKEKLFIRI